MIARSFQGPSAHGLVPIALLLVAPLLSGCGLAVVGHRVDPFVRGTKPEEIPLSQKVQEAREKSAASPGDPEPALQLGRLYLEADSIPQAEAALRTAIARRGGHAPALSLLSKLLYTHRRHEEAVTLLESARAEGGGQLPEVLLAGLALHHQALGHADQAGAIAARLSRSDRDNVPTLAYFGLRGERPDQARELAETAFERNPRSAANQNNYGIARLRAGDLEAARGAFLAAIEIDPMLAGPYYNLAILEKFYALDDGAAAQWLARYRERSSDDPDGLFEPLGDSKTLAEKEDP